MIKRKLIITIEIMSLISGVMFMCSCADKSMSENDVNEKSDDSLWEKIDEEKSGKSGTTTVSSAEKVGAELISEKDAELIADQEADGKNESEDSAGTIIVTPSKLSEISVPEAIVIEDTDTNLIKTADKTETDYPVKTENREIPSLYISDLAEGKDLITPVRNQGYTALCWNFSALGAIEADLLAHYDVFETDKLNLSEKHGAYYNMHKAEGSYNGGIDDDYREFVFNPEKEAWLDAYDTSYLSVGGVADYCVSLYTAWKGPVMDEGDNSFTTIKGQSAIYTDNTKIPTDPYKDNVCHVQGVYEVPATEKNRELIKRMILEHGAVTASVRTEDGFWTGRKMALYDYKRYGGDNVADHEILIIGWDDNYAASKFITSPENNGAFICKNSWGTRYGSEGYFYLSYEDNILTHNNVAAYDCVIEGDKRWYDGNYQYAGFLTQVNDAITDQKNVVYMLEENNKSYGIDITAMSDEELCAVGLFSMSTDMDYEISIYDTTDISVKDYSTDEKADGEKVSAYNKEELGDALYNGEYHLITGGYHTLELSKTIDISKDKSYFVLVTPKKKEKLVFEKEMDYTGEENYDEWKHNLGALHNVNVASGHSFLQDESGDFYIRQDAKDFFVKAYTKKK